MHKLGTVRFNKRFVARIQLSTSCLDSCAGNTVIRKSSLHSFAPVIRSRKSDYELRCQRLVEVAKRYDDNDVVGFLRNMTANVEMNLNASECHTVEIILNFSKLD